MELKVEQVTKGDCDNCLNTHTPDQVGPHYLIEGQVFCPCGHCDEPVGYDPETENYYYVLASTPECFLATSRPVDATLVP